MRFAQRSIRMNRPDVGVMESLAAFKVLKSGNLAQGKSVQLFEQEFSQMHSADHGVACNSGTSALYLILLALKVGPGDEVLVPAFTFGATANAVLMTGATVKFVDVDIASGNMSISDAEGKLTKKTKALIVVHLYGNPIDLDTFSRFSKLHNLFLIQDAAQAHLALWRGKHLAEFGDALAFSFYPTKNMTTIEGGIVLTNDPKIARVARVLRNQGMASRYEYESPGLNLRMSEVSAVIGLAQLRKLKKWTDQRIRNAKFLDSMLEVVTPEVDSRARHVYHQYTIKVSPNLRDELLHHLRSKRIECDVYYPKSLPDYEVFASEFECLNSRLLASMVISIPVHHRLSKSQLRAIVKAVNGFCRVSVKNADS